MLEVDVSSAKGDGLAEPKPAQTGKECQRLVPTRHRLHEREQLGQREHLGFPLDLVSSAAVDRQGVRMTSSSSKARLMIDVRTA